MEQTPNTIPYDFTAENTRTGDRISITIHAESPEAAIAEGSKGFPWTRFTYTAVPFN